MQYALLCVNVAGFVVLIGTVLWKMGRNAGYIEMMLRTHCRDIGIIMRHLGIDPPNAPGRDDPAKYKALTYK